LRKNSFVLCERGFTLIELIAAVALLSLISITFMSAVTSGYFTIVYSGQRTQAAGIAKETMDQLKAAGYQGLAEKAGEDGMNLEVNEIKCVPAAAEEDGEFLQEYNLSREVLEVDDYKVEGIEITVKVYYGEKNRKLVLTSFIFDQKV